MDSMSILSPSPLSICRISPRSAATLRTAGIPLSRWSSSRRLAAQKIPRGFGPAPVKRGKKKNQQRTGKDDEEEEEDDEDDDVDEPEEATIPEVVTNRMMKRMGLSVGAPLSLGLLFFPFFYYLKVGLKVDVPTWVPFIVSFFFFGTALLGISYGIVSTSWDPLREGSLLGWNEAQRNWPVFWNSLRNGGAPQEKKRSRKR